MAAESPRIHAKAEIEIGAREFATQAAARVEAGRDRVEGGVFVEYEMQNRGQARVAFAFEVEGLLMNPSVAR